MPIGVLENLVIPHAVTKVAMADYYVNGGVKLDETNTQLFVMNDGIAVIYDVNEREVTMIIDVDGAALRLDLPHAKALIHDGARMARARRLIGGEQRFGSRQREDMEVYLYNPTSVGLRDASFYDDIICLLDYMDAEDKYMHEQMKLHLNDSEQMCHNLVCGNTGSTVSVT